MRACGSLQAFNGWHHTGKHPNAKISLLEQVYSLFSSTINRLSSAVVYPISHFNSHAIKPILPPRGSAKRGCVYISFIASLHYSLTKFSPPFSQSHNYAATLSVLRCASRYSVNYIPQSCHTFVPLAGGSRLEKITRPIVNIRTKKVNMIHRLKKVIGSIITRSIN